MNHGEPMSIATEALGAIERVLVVLTARQNQRASRSREPNRLGYPRLLAAGYKEGALSFPLAHKRVKRRGRPLFWRQELVFGVSVSEPRASGFSLAGGIATASLLSSVIQPVPLEGCQIAHNLPV